MATYVVLFRLTSQGISNIKDAPKRVDAARQAFKGLGVELKGFYLTMGRYDYVAIIEAPDDTAMAKASLAVGSKGNVTSETLRAFSEADLKGIVSALP